MTAPFIFVLVGMPSECVPFAKARIQMPHNEVKEKAFKTTALSIITANSPGFTCANSSCFYSAWFVLSIFTPHRTPGLSQAWRPQAVRPA